MPATCLDNIISIPGCDIEESSSGYAITDLPGITLKKAASAASEKFVSGLELLKDVRRRAILELKNNIITYLQGNGYVPSLVNNIWSSLDTKYSQIIPASNLGNYRGNVLYNTQSHCLLQKLYIPYVYVKADFTGDLILRIEDGGLFYERPFKSVAGSISRIKTNFFAESDEVHLLIPDIIDVYSVLPNCQCQSSGTNSSKSDCAKVMGYNNGGVTKHEGYGVWADVQCKCDYSYLLCQLSTDGLLGSIALYKMGTLLMDELLSTDRLNYFTIYGKEEAGNKRVEWGVMYEQAWNTLIAALPNILPKIDKCGCIDCGYKRIANV